MKLIVGLGNPGRKYADTRHNVGFHVLARLAEQYASGRPRAKFQGEIADADLQGQRALLLTPLTYMNHSGTSVLQARDFYKIEHPDLLIVCDDFNLPLGRLRFRPNGSSGGQKGLQDIIRRLGNEDLPRLRIGIGPPPEYMDVADYVLSTFSKQEQVEMNESVARAAQAVVDWCHEGIDACMNRYNAG